MKKLLVICTFVLASTSFADCNIKCITRDPFSGKCLFKTKVCDVGSPGDWVEQAGIEGAKISNGVQSIWHEVYGVLPENVRVILNSSTFTIVGAYYGGLEGALLGQSVDRLLVATRARIHKAKTYTEAAPEWKKIIIEDGVALVTVKEQEIITQGQASKQYLIDGIDAHFQNFLECTNAAPEYNVGWACYNKLEDSLNSLVRESRVR